MQEILNEYELLLNKLSQPESKYPETKLTVVNAKVGKDFDNKLMVIGRAVNGWEEQSSLTKGFQSEQILCLIDFLKRNTANTLEYFGGKYNPNKSSFTQVKQMLANHIVGCPKSLSNHSIVWSNLYKVSNFAGGNPSAKLRALQFSNCLNILKLEIELYRPETIVFLTSYKQQLWAKPFLDQLGVTNLLTAPIGLVEFAGMYNGAKVVVGQHPQGKKWDVHFKNIIDALAVIN